MGPFGPPPGMGPFGGPGASPFVAARPSRSGGAGVIVGVIVGLVVLFGAMGAGAFFLVRSRAKPPTVTATSEAAYGGDEAWSDADASVPVSSGDPVWGKRTAPVTLVVFEDFQCPFCGKYRTTLAAVKEKYGPEKVRVVWKSYPLPFHKEARPAAIAAEAVFRLGGSRAFWTFHDAAFAGQNALTPTSFERWAQEAGVDLTRFRELQDDPSVAAKVDADTALAKASGVQGTPNTFINGFLLTGAQPLEKVTSLVDTEMAAAERAIAAGTPADRVYSKLSKENSVKNPPPKKERDKEAEAADEEKVWSVPVGGSPSRGPATAKVTIVVFSEFQCPFCARSVPTLTQLQEIYGDKLRIVWKNNPLAFHKQAAPAAQLAMEARAQKGDTGFWAAHDLLFKNQKALANEDLEAYAAELKLDVARARRAILTEKHKEAIAQDQRLADQLDAKGTPTFFVNGHKITGAQPIEKFKTWIDRELAR
jgi:protein-disulfide isomerase